VINSAPFQYAVMSYSQKGGKSMGSMHVLKYVQVPTFESKNKTHVALAEHSEAAHKAATKGNDAEIREIEAEIDKAAAKLWRLSNEELAEIKRSLEDM